eukprot:TRINITY_DN2616_c0_g1_i4.p1 TRINITY_DN2616_c0_g1~~TRINITY_DN2616_c0_g1_i4.p1  ORF type:complete len:217 (-),score=38.90 TRINITY_DN2616_c0_g1_i4:76-726(-)
MMTMTYSALLIFALVCSVYSHTRVIDSPDHKYVTCGSVIKLQHVDTGHRLHSHQVTYGSGSGQQSVTGFPGADDDNSYWVLKGPHGKPCTQGTPIKKTDKFRMEHVQTGKNLHSHLHRSPLSQQQEVSCFGEGGEGDTGDNWSVIPVAGGEYWVRGEEVRLEHSDTLQALALTSYAFQRPIPGQREIACTTQKTASNTKWKTAEGIYFPKSQTNSQ